MPTQRSRIENFVKEWPGKTQREISIGLYGKTGYQQRVNQDCAMLVATKRIEQRGAGGQADMFRYYPPGRKGALYGSGH
jgi:hypothetical protein